MDAQARTIPDARPCPFCDGTTILLESREREEGRLWWWASCLRCHADGPLEIWPGAAVAMWNCRGLSDRRNLPVFLVDERGQPIARLKITDEQGAATGPTDGCPPGEYLN